MKPKLMSRLNKWTISYESDPQSNCKLKGWPIIQGLSFIASPSTWALSHRNTACARTARDSCDAQSKEKRNTLYFTAHIEVYTKAEFRYGYLYLYELTWTLNAELDQKIRQFNNKCLRNVSSSRRTNRDTCSFYRQLGMVYSNIPHKLHGVFRAFITAWKNCKVIFLIVQSDPDFLMAFYPMGASDFFLGIKPAGEWSWQFNSVVFTNWCLSIETES